MPVTQVPLKRHLTILLLVLKPCPHHPAPPGNILSRPAGGENTYLAQVEEAMLACHAVSHSRTSRNAHSPGVGEDLLATGISSQQDQDSCCYHA